MITPTIGRRIWYMPTPAEREALEAFVDTDPFDAGIVYVHRDGNVNLSITAHNGTIFFRSDVEIVDEDEIPDDGGVAYWMPYQLKQAQG